MKNINKIALFFIFISQIYDCIATTPGIGADAGLNSMKILAPTIKESSQNLSDGLKEVGLKTIEAVLPSIEKLQVSVDKLSDKLVAVSGTLATAIQNAGANAGVGLADKVGSAVTVTCTAIKSASSSVVAVAMAHPVITTVVVGGVIIVIISYGSYKVYRYYHPATSQVDAAKIKLEIIKAQVEIVKLKTMEEKTQKETLFKQALIQHAASTEKAATGIPAACQKAAHELAIVAGQKKVDKIIASFNKYAPQGA